MTPPWQMDCWTARSACAGRVEAPKASLILRPAIRKTSISAPPQRLQLIRSTEEEKQPQLEQRAASHARDEREPRPKLKRLPRAVIGNDNVFVLHG